MRYVFWGASAICCLALMTEAKLQGEPSDPEEKPAVVNDDRFPPPRNGEKPGREDHQTQMKRGVVTEFHKNPNGDIDGFRLDDGTEVRISSQRKAPGRCFSQRPDRDRRMDKSGGIRNPRRNDQE